MGGTEGEFAALWQNALDQYAAASGKRLDDESLPKLGTVESLKEELQKRNTQFSDFRKSRQGLFQTLDMALRPIELISNMAAGLASQAFPPSCLVFGSVMYLVDASKGVSANYDSIRDLFEEIKDFTSRLPVHTRHSVPEELKGIVTEIMVCLIDVCGYSTKLIRHGRVGQYFKRVFLGQDEQIAEKLKNLRKLTEQEQRMVTALTLSITTITSARVDGAVVLLENTNEELRELRSEIIQQFASLGNSGRSPITPVEDHHSEQGDRTQRQLNKIRRVLRPSTTPEEIFRTIASKKVPGTGEWIRNNPTFRSWLEREKPILWLSGRPGAGKSYLSAGIIQYLMQLHPPGVHGASRTSIAYYFCKDYDPDLRSFKKALRTVAWSICQNDPVYAKHVANVCLFPESISSTLMIWEKLFVEFFTRPAEDHQNTVYVLIDGLDEAYEEERRNFLELLQIFQSPPKKGNTRLRVQIVLIGRPELSQVLDDILGESIPTITISAENNSQDIIEYVRTNVAKIKNLRKVPKELRAEIVSALTKGADGMFLWVDLMLQEIAAKHHQGQIKQALNTAPKGLKDTICHVLERFSRDLQSDDIEDLNQLLSWVSCAIRPLALGELDDIMKLKSKDGTGLIDLETDLRKRFTSFFAVSREDGLSTDELKVNLMRQYADNESSEKREEEQEFSDDSDAGEFDADMDIVSDPQSTDVTLAHASIGDYFREEPKTTAVGVDINRSHADIAIFLMQLICDQGKFEQWRDATLTSYACHHWQDHLGSIKINAIDAGSRADVTKYLILMVRDPEVALRWMAIQSAMEKTWFYHDRNRSAIREWLWNARKDHPGVISEADKRWINTLYPQSDADVMDLAVNIAAQEWLKGFSWDPALMFRCLRAHLASIECRRNGTEFPQRFPPLDQEEPASIMAAAKSVRFEEDATWHTRVGSVLYKADRFKQALERAIEEYQAAIALEPLSWRAHYGLAWAYYERDHWSKADKSMCDCLHVFEENAEIMAKEKENYVSCLGVFTRWRTNYGDPVLALESADIAFRIQPRDYSNAALLFRLLTEKKAYEDIMNRVTKMKHDIVPSLGYSRLIEMCILRCAEDLDPFAGITAAARATENLSIVRDTLDVSLKIARKNANFPSVLGLEMNLGLLLFREYNDSETAMNLWKSILENSGFAKPGSPSFRVRYRAAEELCRIYADRAVSSGAASQEFTTSVEKLEDLLKMVDRKSPMGQKSEEWANGAKQAIMLTLGMLYRLSDRQAEARQCFLPHIKLGVELLQDDDPENDWIAYSKLGKVFIHAGDDLNFQICCSATLKWVECAGICGLGAMTAYGFNACRVCINMDFCDSCLELMRQDELPVKKCNPRHEFIRYGSCRRGSMRGLLREANEEITVPQWVERIRKGWKLR